MSTTDYQPTEYRCFQCGRPKNSHLGEAHAFEHRAIATSTQTVMDCACGAAFRSEVERDVVALHEALKAEGWRIIAGAWRCPRCGQRHDRAEERKTAQMREKLKSEQGGLRW